MCRKHTETDDVQQGIFKRKLKTQTENALNKFAWKTLDIFKKHYAPLML